MRDLVEEILTELRQAAEWFGDEEHGEPLVSPTLPEGRLAEICYQAEDGPRIFLSERSYFSICEALVLLDELDQTS